MFYSCREKKPIVCDAMQLAVMAYFAGRVSVRWREARHRRDARTGIPPGTKRPGQMDGAGFWQSEACARLAGDDTDIAEMD